MSNEPSLKENTHVLSNDFRANLFLNVSENISNLNSVLHIHWHDSFEIIFIKEGNAIFQIGSVEYYAENGDILFVNQGELHSGYLVNNTKVTFYAIVFDKSVLSYYIPDTQQKKLIYPFIEGKMTFPSIVKEKSENYIAFLSFVNSIIYEFEQKKTGYEIAVKCLLSMLTLQVIRAKAYTEQIGKIYIKDNRLERFKFLFNYIEAHFPEKITIEIAANLVNLSSYHFCKVFKKVTGKTFIEFLNLYRINEAEDLLRETDLPITLVAEKVGFCNINYFDKIFKKYKRYSPSTCRK
ncbi:MAG TPA: AraC family transcriptional regulator [Ruminiclostridium sp.]